MLFRIPSVRHAGLRRLGWERWRAIDADPQFVYAPWLVGAAFLVFEIENADRDLDPRVFLDYGEDFERGEEIELRQTRDGVYVVAVKSFGRVRRVRFDPASFPSLFAFRAFAARDEKSVRAFVGGKLRKAAMNGVAAPCCEIVARAGADDLSALGPRATKIRGVPQHFDQVIAMAMSRYGHAAPWEGERPLISFLTPVYNTKASYLDQLVDSFRLQRPGAAELILADDGSTTRETIDWLDRHVDDPRLTILRAPANRGIAAATNMALFAATGEWAAFIDHDDALTPFAVDAVVDAIEQNPGAQCIYTDELVTDGQLRPKSYVLKPAYDPVLLSGVNYVNHLSLFRRARLMELGGLRPGFDGSQDYDLLLRYLRGLSPDEVVHLPYPAYLWRRDGSSYSCNFLDRATDNARRALAENYAEAGAPARVEPALDANLHRVRLPPPGGDWPLVSVVVPSRDAYTLISRLMNDLTRKTDYPALEIIVVDNGSADPRVLALYDEMRRTHPAFRAEIDERPFNFAAQVNRGLRAARGDCVLLLNNDVEVIDAGWLKEMVSCLSYPSTGVVGARLLYPNGSLQHAGVIVGLGSVAGHWFCGMPGEYPGPMARLKVRQSFAAATGACLLITRACLEAVGELDEEKFAIAYNDIDFCLRAGRAGYRIVWTPFATLYHHESASRGSDETKANIERFRREQEALRSKYGLLDYDDPAFNPWYSRDNATPRLVLPARLPKPRRFRA
ncbi:glycosyltransferase family 2 protein [Methylosinus sp. 3S-1]|uniref:Glycosyltransferase n=1 Tax=Methylosinus trichosporium (strain ATCC 35070 / NCIMB 11131 / UNIQEM 75 / OB3b) TaxID=595536 RepID=A0A2D2CYF7_METT3|nr:glycosyltransferase [Methylosinus trichosporium OB3b]